MTTIFHLALSSDWEAARGVGVYLVSTRGRSLAAEGFIHASRADQWPAIREAFYADVREPLVLLQIDTELLDVPVVEEPAEAAAPDRFPHIYGPLRVDAVVRAHPLPAPAASPAPPERRAAAPGHDSFSAVYFREMFVNAGLVLLVVALGCAGILLGLGIGDTTAPAVGGLAGTATGAAVAVRLFRQRHRRGRGPPGAGG